MGCLKATGLSVATLCCFYLGLRRTAVALSAHPDYDTEVLCVGCCGALFRGGLHNGALWRPSPCTHSPADKDLPCCAALWTLRVARNGDAHKNATTLLQGALMHTYSHTHRLLLLSVIHTKNMKHTHTPIQIHRGRSGMDCVLLCGGSAAHQIHHLRLTLSLSLLSAGEWRRLRTPHANSPHHPPPCLASSLLFLLSVLLFFSSSSPLVLLSVPYLFCFCSLFHFLSFLPSLLS